MVPTSSNRPAGLRISSSAADIAKLGRPVDRRRLRSPGDLVFFNTLNRFAFACQHLHRRRRFTVPHRPSSASGRVRIDFLGHSRFAPRYRTAQLFD